jgi:hypothetical protein
MSNLTDVESVIKTSKAGLMLYGRVIAAGESSWQTVLYVREDNQHIKWIPPNPIVEIRAGAMQQDNVVLIPIVVKLCGEYYETWINFYSPDLHGEGALRELARQEHLVILIFGDSGTQDRSIQVNNSLKKTFSLILEGVQKRPTWSMGEFDQAREKVYAKFETVPKLWRELRG